MPLRRGRGFKPHGAIVLPPLMPSNSLHSDTPNPWPGLGVLVGISALHKPVLKIKRIILNDRYTIYK